MTMVFLSKPSSIFVDDGLNGLEIAASFVAWLGDLDGVPVVVLPVSAGDELRNADAAEDI